MLVVLMVSLLVGMKVAWKDEPKVSSLAGKMVGKTDLKGECLTAKLALMLGENLVVN